MRARSRAKSLRRDECSSGSIRSVSAGAYPGASSATCRVRFALGEPGPLRLVQLARGEPALRERRVLRAAGASALALRIRARVGLGGVELPEQLVDLVEARRPCERCAQLAAHRVPLEVPGDVLADVAAGTSLVAVEEVDEQF